MARNCGCAGASCGCKIVAGNAGINIWGIGTADDPYLITADIDRLAGNIEFNDTPTVNFTVTGEGTPIDPMNVTAVANAAPFPVYTTAGRPSAVTAGAGAFYYDATTELPMWSDGTVWQSAFVAPATLHPKVGGYLGSEIRATGNSATAGSGATVYGVPIFVTKQMTIDSMHMRVITAEAATSAKLLLYSSDADGHPTALIAQATVDASTIGYKIAAIAAPLVLAPGLYWAHLRSNSPGNLMRYTSITPQGLPGLSDGTAGPYASMTITTSAGSYAAPPNPIAAWAYADAASTNAPWIALRRSA